MAAKKKRPVRARAARAGASVRGGGGAAEYTINLAPVEDPEERFGRRMKLSHALEREGIEVTGEGCGVGEGTDLGCDIGVRTSRADLTAIAKRLATQAGLRVVSVVRVEIRRAVAARVDGLAMSVQPPRHDCYGPEHKMGMVVPKGGSSCARCAFGHMEKDGPHCSNTCWVETPKANGGGGGKTHLPVMDPSMYCCDMYAIVKKTPKAKKPAAKPGKA